MRLSYLLAGETRHPTGPTVLLIHGSGVSARSWTPQVTRLGEAVPVLAIDLPGHGESDPIPEVSVERYAEAAYRLLDCLEIEPVAVAGHSLGGAVSMALAARHPERVAGLVLLATCAKLPERGGSLESTYWWLPRSLRERLFLRIAEGLLFAPGANPRAIRSGMEDIRACPRETIRKDIAAATAMDLRDVAQALRVPTRIVCGDQDRLIPPSLSRRLHELIPGSRLEILEGAGHMLPLERPEQISRAILELVRAAPGEARKAIAFPAPIRPSILKRLRKAARALFSSRSR